MKSRSDSPRLLALTFFSLLLALPGTLCHALPPVSVHPSNGHYFEFRGHTTVLVGSSEHYGAVIHLDFDYLRYLDETRACGLNLVRVFTGTYLEGPGSFNITENTLAPAASRFVAPWKRTSVPGAAAGGNKFDLNQWDPSYFYRLKDFVRAASERGIVVELTLFGAFYDDILWGLSPMNAVNHINGVGASGRAACFSPTGNLLPFQKALTRKCAEELRGFDNVIFEICNEPYQQGVSAAWENLIVDEIVATQASFPHRHLIARNVFNYQGTVTNPHPAVSLLNFHYAFPAAVTQNYALNLPLGDDETGNAGQEDFTYRREAWEFLLAGGGLFNHLDFSFTAAREDGIAAQSAPGGGGPAIRRQLGILRWFLEDMPLANLSPQPGFVAGGIPSGGAVQVLGASGLAYGLYLRGGTQANLILNLPAGTYRGEWIDTRSGLTVGSIAVFVHPGGQKNLPSPAYAADIALRLFGGTMPPPRVVMTAPYHNSIIASTEITLEADASVENGTILGVEFLDGSTSLGLVTNPPYQISLIKTSPGTHSFRAKVHAVDGRTSFSLPQKVTVAGPYHGGVNLNGGSVALDGVVLQSQSEAVTAGLAITNAQMFTSSGGTLYPAAGIATSLVFSKQLLRTGTNAATELGFGYPIANGHYDVFLFIVEDQTAFSRDMRLLIEGQMVGGGIGSLALGEWHKYGPYRTEVTDGVLNLGLLRDSKGTPKIAAFSLYQAAAPQAFADVTLGIDTSDGVAVLTYPSGLPNVTVEAADHPGGTWEELTDPVSNFLEYDVIPVPVDRPARFFRLRQD